MSQIPDNLQPAVPGCPFEYRGLSRAVQPGKADICRGLHRLRYPTAHIAHVRGVQKTMRSALDPHRQPMMAIPQCQATIRRLCWALLCQVGARAANGER
jgi:hypothetical protein